jgi:hypothetical protein
MGKNMSMLPLNTSIETVYEIEVTPEQLFDIANKLEHGAKVAHIGQVIRVKLNASFSFVFRPSHNNKIVENVTLTRSEK